MNRLTKQLFRHAQINEFSSQDVSFLLPGSENSRQALVKRAIAQGEIIHIRRGLYCLAPEYRKKPINLFAIAQQVYGPSYISLESALSYHGWIPEAVSAYTSVCLKNSKDFQTPLGLFSYKRVPQRIFYAGVERRTDDHGNVFLMAGPIKALGDYVYIHKLDWLGVAPVIQSLRVESEELRSASSESIESMVENYRSLRVRKFLKGLQKDLYR
jgi:hypothetical protein